MRVSSTLGSAFLILLSPVICIGQSTQTVSLDAIDNIARSAVFLRADRVVKIESFPSSGSGFFVHPDGYILTNWHVVADQIEGYLWEREREMSAKVIKLTAVIDSGSLNERELPAKIIARDRKRDLALLKVNYRPDAYIDLNVIDDVRLGERIWTAGFPFGDMLAMEKKTNLQDMPNPEVTLAAGMVTSLRRDTEGNLTMVQTDAALNPGSSGSPMVNADGHLVGVVFAGISGGQGLGFGISPNRIREFVKRQAIRVSLEPRVILSPPQPIKVSVTPVLVDFDSDTGQVLLEGDDIQTVMLNLEHTENGLQTIVDFPERIPGLDRPLRYFLTVNLSTVLAGQRFHQRYALDAVPESFERLRSARDPGEMMQDRKILAHEMLIEDFNKSTKVSGQGSKKSLADVAKEMKLKTSDSGSIVLDNQTVGEISGSKGDNERFRGVKDPELRSLLFQYSRIIADIESLQNQRDTTNSYDHRRYLYGKINELGRKKSTMRSTLVARGVRKCTDSGRFFVAKGDRIDYPCEHYTSSF